MPGTAWHLVLYRNNGEHNPAESGCTNQVFDFAKCLFVQDPLARLTHTGVFWKLRDAMDIVLCPRLHPLNRL